VEIPKYGNGKEKHSNFKGKSDPNTKIPGTATRCIHPENRVGKHIKEGQSQQNNQTGRGNKRDKKARYQKNSPQTSQSNSPGSGDKEKTRAGTWR